MSIEQRLARLEKAAGVDECPPPVIEILWMRADEPRLPPRKDPSALYEVHKPTGPCPRCGRDHPREIEALVFVTPVDEESAEPA